jgi:hypothetical protein
MKRIYLKETLELIGSKDVNKANEIVESGEVKFIIKGEEQYPYVVINEDENDNEDANKEVY